MVRGAVVYHVWYRIREGCPIQLDLTCAQLRALPFHSKQFCIDKIPNVVVVGCKLIPGNWH